MKILFFIENLRTGGKERRLLELLGYLKHNTDYQLFLVLMDDWIDYPYLSSLEVEYTSLKRSFFKKDPLVFFKFYKAVTKFNPDIIHTWGPTTTFYAIPTKIILGKILLANIISNAKISFKRFSFESMVYSAGFIFADKILSNSKAGLVEYGLHENPKSMLIYNGIRLSRFSIQSSHEEIRSRLQVNNTHKVIIMVASTSKNKDYDLFLDVAKLAGSKDASFRFFGVGQGEDLMRLKGRINQESISNVILLGKRSDIEEIISIADICVLFTNNKLHGEGISNAIMEYMASKKVVISTDSTGGTSELIETGVNGFIMDADPELIFSKMEEILSNEKLKGAIGETARLTIEDSFTIDIMGKNFQHVYQLCD